jgi:hypothetical protein
LSTWESFAIGNRWTTSQPTTTQPRSLTPASAPLNLGTLTVVEGSKLTADAARDRLDAASTTLRTAFAAFTSHSKPVFTTTVVTRPAAQAAFVGSAARVSPVAGSYSAVQTTVKVNTQTSTVRSSTSAIGFDLTSAHSTLASAPLSLDVTSPERASTLNSTSGLGLDVVDRASTLTSNGEMNGAARSLASSSLAFSGSTSRMEISGAYTGDATALTFKLTKSATVGGGVLFGNIGFEVRDQNGVEVASYQGRPASGEIIDLSTIGLKVRFTDGNLARNAETSTAVVQTPTAVDTTAAFNASWGSAPLFDNFGRVNAGSFQVNGVSIAVSANDSINSVLTKINGSSAGVSASVSGDRVVLSSTSPSEANIVVGNDTSGFLAATKLSAATTTRGNIRDDQQVLSQTTQFGGVTSGSFLVNGVSIAVDRNTDTLASIVSRINGAGAGVTAAYDSATDKVVLTTMGNSEDAITVSGDTTGFLAAARLAGATTVAGNIRDDQQMLTKTSQFAGVTDGAFQINGQTIAVDAEQDSLATVIQRINDAGAGVTARYDAASDRLELESVQDSEDPIVVGNDSSGFLSVAGLSTGNTVIGAIADSEQTLSATAAFGGVTAGSFEVNGVSIAVDPDADTLDEVLSRINGASAGVTASYDFAADRLVFTPTTAGATLSLRNDTSGFLAAANIAAGAAGTSVDPDAAFDGSTGNGPLFDPGQSVQAGGFSINGVTIAVAANDSVNTVLSRINASAAGVTATFDSDTQLVRLTTTTHTDDPITFGADTSGFLAAMKLDGTAQSTGGAATLLPYDSPLGRFAEYAAVSAGTLTINGQQIVIDPNSTTVRDLVATLDSVAGMDATLDEWTGGIRVFSTQTGGSIQVSDTSGILDTLGIDARTYHGSPATTTVTETQTGTEVVSNAVEVAASVSAAAVEFTDVLSDLAASREGDEAFLNALLDAATDAVDALGDAGVRGLTIGGEGTDVRLVVDREALASALDGLTDPGSLSAVVADVLSEFAARAVETLAMPAPVAAAPEAQTFSLAQPALAATQAAAAALFQKALERVTRGDAGKERENSAADGALDVETRMRIKAQLEAETQAVPGLAAMFDTLRMKA